MTIGFTILRNAGGVELRLAQPEGPARTRPALVSLARDRRGAAVLLGRLLYRDDVLARLPEPRAGNEASDAELALAVYRHEGQNGLERLEGEFSLVVWDSVQRRLLALRDPLGAWPLFWFVRGETAAVSTSLAALVSLQPGRSFDLDFLAEYLMRPYPAAELPCERTAFESVHRILPGTLLEIDPAGQVSRRRTWDWGSRIEPVVGITLEEAGTRFAQLFRQAVRQRIGRGPVAADLSGGMDSSSVVCAARAALPGGQPLHTLSLVYDHPSLAGERGYIDLVVRQGGSVVPHYLHADAALDFDWFREDIPTHDEPCSGLRGLAMQRLLVDAADRAGAATT